ncbi:MAG TPA: PadR family transcriptional regulator [Bacteroidetes bacterium]|nr:PadR family transcriptional regulator [Bacteroidota bacterium]
MVEKIASKIQKGMKRGFIGMFILFILKNKHLHGYQIIKEIEKRSLGIWKPTVSTMYTILKNLKEKGLIKPVEGEELQEGKIIYKLTEKGLETLELLKLKQQEMRAALNSIISSTIGEEGEMLKLGEGHFPDRVSFFIKEEDMPIEKKIQMLKIHRSMIKEKIKYFDLELKNIEQKLQQLEDRKENEK